jgi:CO/xanthine dehydrogenase FAD-binding subunit
VLVDPAAPTTGLVPVADFRGSYEYRLMLAATLADRVLGRLG